MRFFLYAFLFLIFPLTCHTLPTSSRSEKVLAAHQGMVQTACLKAGVSLASPLFIRLFKEDKPSFGYFNIYRGRVELWGKVGERYNRIFSFPIIHFPGGFGPPTTAKETAHNLPEGFFEISQDQLIPLSAQYLGVSLGHAPGSPFEEGLNGTSAKQVMLHGGLHGRQGFGIGRKNMSLLYTALHIHFSEKGVPIPVHVFPFHFTTDNLYPHRQSQHLKFWNALLPAYFYFEKFAQLETETGCERTDDQHAQTTPSPKIERLS